jgi:HAD superfamily hydrolase (TIGR01549 family)
MTKAVFFDADGTLWSSVSGLHPDIVRNKILDIYLVNGDMKKVKEYADQEIQLDPKLIPVLKVLKTNGVKLGVISNHIQECLMGLMDHFNISDYFDVIITSSLVQAKKEELVPIKYAMFQLGAGNKDVIMVGDSFERDILPSRELGLDAYLLRMDYNLNKDSNYLFSLSEVPALLGLD